MPRLAGTEGERPRLEFVGAFESTYQPAHDVGVAETTGHADRWRGDLAFLAACGVTRLRDPVRRRYPWVEEYALFNGPFATLFLCGHEGAWPPYARGVGPLVRISSNVLPAVSEASRMYADLLPGARHVYVDTCEAHRAGDDAPASRAAAGASVPLEGYCWFPFVASCDWDSLLARADGHVDAVGVYWLDADRERRPSAMASLRRGRPRRTRRRAAGLRPAPVGPGAPGRPPAPDVPLGVAAAPAARLGAGAPTIRPRPLRMGGPE